MRQFGKKVQGESKMVFLPEERDFVELPTIDSIPNFDLKGYDKTSVIILEDINNYLSKLKR